MLRFDDLTAAQRGVICNGCGPKGGWVPVPDFMFGDSCDKHDFGYWVGGCEDDRRRVDHDFLVDMLRAAYPMPELETLAITYWMAVRLFGSLCFHYSARQRDETDLFEIMQAQYIAILPGQDTIGCV